MASPRAFLSNLHTIGRCVVLLNKQEGRLLISSEFHFTFDIVVSTFLVFWQAVISLIVCILILYSCHASIEEDIVVSLSRQIPHVLEGGSQG